MEDKNNLAKSIIKAFKEEATGFCNSKDLISILEDYISGYQQARFEVIAEVRKLIEEDDTPGGVMDTGEWLEMILTKLERGE